MLNSPIDNQVNIPDLQRRLLAEVALLYRSDSRRWKMPIVETLRELRSINLQAVLFGGTLRSLLVPRLLQNKPGRPRDIDIVVAGATVNTLRDHFESIVARETRFGGLQLRRRDWHFDVWPLQATWAFINDSVEHPDFSALPSTTFFNLEAIAVEVWPQPGHARRIFSGDGQFFNGLIQQTLEINREENPFPGLCVVRALVMATSLDFKLGPRLIRYVADHGSRLRDDELEHIQRAHYGQVRICASTMRSWIELLVDAQMKGSSQSYRLPIARQLELDLGFRDHTCINVYSATA
jgi:hypothetical protein